MNHRPPPNHSPPPNHRPRVNHTQQQTTTGEPQTAVFTLDNGRTRTVHFGAAGASDFTQHRDVARKQRYLARHRPREDWTKPMTAGALARWLLWNRETLRESVADYLHRFDLTPG